MKLSEAWLREWVDPPVSSAALTERLTLAGHELESIEPVAPPLEGVVVGRVLEVRPHPNAERLRVCRVDDGRGHLLEVVCGAPNVVADMRAPLAVDGAVLPGGLRIRRSKLRGVTSEGMLCSARELGLGDDAGGIVALPADAPLGRDLRSYLALDDRAIDLAITANRGDCLSVAGIAREVGALYGLPVRAPAWPALAAAHQQGLPIRLEAPAACPAYAGRVIRALRRDAVTPLWMCERLRRAGLRPLHPVVDITNYVMLELGQPLHAFDFARLSGAIRVRQGRAGETLTLLDGREVALDPDLLVIADERGPLALGGLMGGLSSAVTADTHSIFLEAAYFAPLAIAGRARRLGMQTDAGYRFERGVDPQLHARAIERATALIAEIAGGAPGPVCRAVEPEYLPRPSEIRLRRARLARIIGMAIPDDVVQGILERLGLRVQAHAEGWTAIPPSFRFDLAIEEDLAEEVARIYGYDAIPPRLEQVTLTPKAEPEGRVSVARARTLLVDRGYQEAITYSFVEPGLQQLFEPDRVPHRLANPISAELAAMRVSLWPGLVSALKQNLARQQARVRMFELGVKYLVEGTERKEEETLAGIVCGSAVPEQWGVRAETADFYDVKADVEALLQLGGPPGRFRFDPGNHSALHPGRSVRIHREGESAGWIGALHPRVQRALELSAPVYLFELQVDQALEARLPVFKPLSLFPAVRRDLALIVDEAVPVADLLEAARLAAPAFLRSLFLFDVYRGKGVDSGRKSVALGLILQDSSRTLTDGDADEAVAAVRSRLEHSFNARIRE